MNNFQRNLDQHLTREQPGDALDDVYTLAEQFVDVATERIYGPEETFIVCRICGDVDSHSGNCPVPALEKWVNS